MFTVEFQEVMQRAHYSIPLSELLLRANEGLPLVQDGGAAGHLPVFLRGEFYLADKLAQRSLSWLKQQGEIVISCPYPEALVKLEADLTPVSHIRHFPLNLSIFQGAQQIFSGEITKPATLKLYASLLEGMNALRLQVQGKVLSPFEASGANDSRQLSFAFSNFRTTLLA